MPVGDRVVTSTAAPLRPLQRAAFVWWASVTERNDGGWSAERRASHSRERPTIQIPKDIFERVRTLCRALPEVTVRVDESRSPARSAAHSFDIRRRSFCLLVAVEGPTGASVPLLVLRAGDERDVLLSTGHPFFAPRAGRDRIGVLLTTSIDWQEIRELVTDSYRIVAPRKLTALLD